MSVVLSVQNLTRYYGKIKAVDHISFEVYTGSVYGILGPNGSGKTTTLSMLMGAVSPRSGSFEWFGQSGNFPAAYRKVGSLIESPYFYPYLTLVQNLKIVAKIKGVSEKDIRRVLEIVQLWKRKTSQYKTLSLGMKQRLGIAAVLLGDPEVLVLDEPANALDPEGIADVRRIILQEAGKGKTILMASHILDEVEKVCSHVAVLKQGRLIASGRVDELLSKGEVLVVSARENDRLAEILEGSRLVKHIRRENDQLILTLEKEVTPDEINALAIREGIVLSRIETKQKSLESQFLELVKE